MIKFGKLSFGAPSTFLVKSQSKLLLVAICLILSVLLAACDVHQFPEIKEPEPDVPDEPVLPAETVEVPVTLEYSTDFYVWEHYYDPILGRIQELYPEETTYPDYPGATSKYDNTRPEGVMDVHVKAYEASNSGRTVKELNFSIDLTGNSYDTSFLIELPKDTKYRLAVWSHLRPHSEASPFYDISDFQKISIIGSNYDGNTDYGDGFSGDIRLDTYGEASEPYKINMTRPMGKFEMVTIDLSEFLDRETTRRNLSTRASADEYYVVISFPYYYPDSYSLLDDRLENSVSGVSFQTKMTVTGTSEASLGFEYVMLNAVSDGAVQARVDIYDPDFAHVAGSTNLTIPMRRDTHTLLRGKFLSQENNGGVGIDPDFDGDFNITM